MPKVSGIFERFDNLDTISIEEFFKWLKHTPDPVVFKNFLANRLLYSQTIPVSVDEMEWELAILREAVKTSPDFFNPTARKIFIPASFLSRVPDLSKLVWVFVDAYLLNWSRNNPGQNVWTVILRSEEKQSLVDGEVRDEIIGSVIIPELAEKSSSIEISANQKNVQIPKGGLAVIPCDVDKCRIAFKVHKGVLFGINEGMVEVYGGRLGLFVDGR